MKAIDLSLTVHVVPEEAIDTDPLSAGETREDVFVKLSPRYPVKLQRKIAQAIERTIHQHADMIAVRMQPAAAAAAAAPVQDDPQAIATMDKEFVRQMGVLSQQVNTVNS